MQTVGTAGVLYAGTLRYSRGTPEHSLEELLDALPHELELGLEVVLLRLDVPPRQHTHTQTRPERVVPRRNRANLLKNRANLLRDRAFPLRDWFPA